MELNIETREELMYVMDFYQIPFVPLHDGGCDLGTIKRDMSYVRPRFGGRSFRSGYEDMAIKLAFEQIKDVIELKQKLDSEVTVTQTEFYRHDVWSYPDYQGGPAVHHVYPKEVTDETDRKLTGTLREIFNKTYKGNNSLRYCNGMWIGFKDKDLERQYRLFLRMDWEDELPITVSDTF